MNSLVLLKPHTHTGKAFASGARLEVDSVTAEWLLAQGIARIDSADAIAFPSHQPSQPTQPSKPHKDPKP